MIRHNQLINPKKMHIFSVVAEMGHITHAAQKLNLSQPAISNSLLSLEQFFGTKLYELVGREISITETGKRLLKHWSNIEVCYQNILDEFEEIIQGEQGDISIAMLSTAKYFMFEVIQAFSKNFPKVHFSCHIFDRNQIFENLLSHRFTLGVMTEPPQHPALSSIQLGENPLVLICSPEHPFAHQLPISFEDLLAQHFITREFSAQITQNLYQLFEKNQSTPRIVLSINSTEAIKEAVIENLGIALVPYLAVARELQAQKIIKINYETQLINHWYLIYVKNKVLTKATQSFIDTLGNFSCNFHSIV